MNFPRLPTTPMPPRNPQRRQQILEALAQMLEDHPGDRITTARLAQRVGVSEAALYRHFPSKARMFDELIAFIEETLFQRIALILQEETQAQARSEKMLLLLLTFSERNPGISPTAHGRRARRRDGAPACAGGAGARSL
jgi:TetR/AcrR family transcriptional regulator